MPSRPKKHEPTDWRFAIEQIGRELGKIYRQPKRLPRRLRAVVTQLKRKVPVRRGPQREPQKLRQLGDIRRDPPRLIICRAVFSDH